MGRKNVHPAGPGCLATGAALDAAIGPHQGKAAANSAWCARRWAVELREYRRVSKDDLSQLYARRWNVELDLRNLKTTTGMDVLRCQTPEMNHKQLWAHLLAYNVIRLLMAQAASNAGKDPRELSFKHTVQLWSG